jgi:predicted TIM-barrel fold metal-dependent hydrolase
MSEQLRVSRRAFFGTAAATAAPLASAPHPAKVINAHDHLHHHGVKNWEELDRLVIEAADKLGVEQICCSILPLERPTTMENARLCNQWLLDAMRRYPGRILGYVFVNPGYQKEALEEVRRYVDGHGFIGVKLYNDYRIDEPVLEPLLQLAGQMRIPILEHAGHSHRFNPEQPRISDGGHIAEAARKFPETMLICAHICGGGDWEWTAKALRNAPSVYLDTSGSVIDEGTVEFAVRMLGADRILFACDMSWTAGIGHIRGAELSDEDRRKILGGNMQRILSRRARA